MESEKTSVSSPKYFYGDDVFKDVITGLIDNAWKVCPALSSTIALD